MEIEIEIFVGERGTWVVVEYPPTITESNDLLIELLKESEDDRTDTVDTAKIPPGLHKIKASLKYGPSNFESTYDDDCWVEFELTPDGFAPTTDALQSQPAPDGKHQHL